MAGLVYQEPYAATQRAVARIEVTPIAVIPNGEDLNVAPRSVAPPNAAFLDVAIQIAVLVGIHAVLIVAPILVLVVAVIQEPNPVRDARSVDFHEEFRGECHAVAPKQAPVVLCVAVLAQG